MELVFQENQVEYLNRILCDTVIFEQTADVVVPDALPDIDRVVDAFGNVIIRSEECTAGSASAGGTVQAGVIYVGEDGSVQTVPAEIPFSARRDFPKDQEDCTLQCRCSLASVDARPLNSRKLLVRVSLSCCLTVYAGTRCMFYDLPDPASNLQLRRTELPLQMPAGLGEKSFVLNEELELKPEEPAVERLLKYQCRPRILEQNVVGDKAVFKGSLQIHALYEDREEKLHSRDWSVAFSQYAQLPRELDGGALDTCLSMTSAEVEPDSPEDCRRLLFSGNVLAQCTVLGEQKLSFIEDAFCTDALLKPEFASCEMTGILDRQTFRENAVAEEAAGVPVDLWVCPGEPETVRAGGKITVRQPLSCSLLYYDENGGLQGKILKPSVSAETALSENGSCRVTEADWDEAFCGTGPEGPEVRIPVTLTLECSALQTISGIKSVKIEDLPEEERKRPSVILRRTCREEDLWELAKACRTPVKNILEANSLEGDVVPADTMLLIPL